MQPPDGRSRPSGATWGGAAAAAATTVVLAPWARPGALLVRDLVAVADPAWSAALLDGTQRLPRDIPGEVLVAVAGQVLPGDLVVRLALAVALVALGAGAGRLLGQHRWPAAVAGLVAVWNPYVLARLHQGQWLVIVALATLPWIVVHLVADDRPRLARDVVLAGTSGFLAPLVVGPTLVVVGVATRRWRALAVGVGTMLVVALPWLVVTGPIVPDPDGVPAFAPSADLPAGVLPSLLSGGGYFNTAVASPWRARWVVAVLALALTALAAWGAVRWVRSGAGSARRARAALVGAALALVLATAAASTTVGQRALADLVEALPASAALRDTQRLLAPWVVVLAVGAGAAADRLGRTSGEGPAIAATVALLTVVALPDPVIGPRLPPPSDLPDAWQQAAREVASDPAPVLVVPHGQTQRYAFTDGRPVAMPLRRLIAAPVLVDTRLVVGTDDGDLVVEDVAGGDAARALAAAWPAVDAASLTAAGIGWVAITDGTRAGPPPAGTTTVVSSPTLELVGVDEAPQPSGPAGPPRPVLALDLLVATAAAGALLLPMVRRRDQLRGNPSQREEDG